MLKAYGKYVLIRHIPSRETYGSGLLKIPDQYKKVPNQGIVVQVGTDVEYVKVGHYVPFEELRGEDIIDKNNRYRLIHEDSIHFHIELEEEEIDGLFHRGSDIQIDPLHNQYFPATISSVIQILAEHYSEKPTRPIQEYKEIR